jgi:hypothetical protein
MSSTNAIGWLAFPTLNRRALLRRAIRSYVRNLDEHGRSANLLVVSGSSQEGERDHDLDMLRALSSSTGRKMFYVGAREKQACIEWLSKTGHIAARVARFALFGDPSKLAAYGANRNAVLLATSGHAVLSADDDTVCQLGSMAPATEPTFHVDEKAHPEELWFHEGRGQAVRSIQWRSADLLGWHEWMLGRALPSNGSAAPRVAAVSTGAVGDCAMSSPAGMIATSNEPTRSRLVASEDAYRCALSSREIVRQTLLPAVSDSPQLMMTSTSLDNRALLPPFMPVCRNEDGVFGHLLRRCWPEAHIGHVPFTILHAPKERRTYDPTPLCMRVSEAIHVCVESWSQSTAPLGSPEERLESVGWHLFELGSQPQPDFDHTIHSLTCGAALSRIESLLALLDRHRHEPPYWADDIRRQILILERAAADPWFSIPQELRVQGSSQHGMAELKSLIVHYGLLLRSWPSIRAMTAKAAYRLATEVRA